VTNGTGDRSVTFARRVFAAAGIYGVLVLAPQYFMEGRIGRDFPPPITHPEHFYRFIGVALAWQVLFLVSRETRSDSGRRWCPPFWKSWRSRFRARSCARRGASRPWSSVPDSVDLARDVEARPCG